MAKPLANPSAKTSLSWSSAVALVILPWQLLQQNATLTPATSTSVPALVLPPLRGHAFWANWPLATSWALALAAKALLSLSNLPLQPSQHYQKIRTQKESKQRRGRANHPRRHKSNNHNVTSPWSSSSSPFRTTRLASLRRQLPLPCNQRNLGSSPRNRRTTPCMVHRTNRHMAHKSKAPRHNKHTQPTLPWGCCWRSRTKHPLRQ